MKKIKVVQIIGFILCFVYVGLFVSDLIWGYIGDFREMLFSVLLVIVSISMLTKGVFLKSQSTLWFGITLVLSAILMLIFSIFNVDYILYNYIYILLPIIASMINIAVFHNLIYIKVIILNITIAIPFVISKIVILDVFWYFLIGVISVFLGIVVCRFIKMKKEKV